MSRSLRSPEANRDGGSVPLRTLGRPPNPPRRIKTIGAGPAEADHVAGWIVEPRFRQSHGSSRGSWLKVKPSAWSRLTADRHYLIFLNIYLFAVPQSISGEL